MKIVLASSVRVGVPESGASTRAYLPGATRCRAESDNSRPGKSPLADGQSEAESNLAEMRCLVMEIVEKN